MMHQIPEDFGQYFDACESVTNNVIIPMSWIQNNYLYIDTSKTLNKVAFGDGSRPSNVMAAIC